MRIGESGRSSATFYDSRVLATSPALPCNLWPMTLAELGLNADDGPIMLIAPPDDVLAEAGRMKPRPSVASTLQVAEPTRRIAWWAERRLLNPGSLSRLRWMIPIAGGEAWLIFDPADDEPLTVEEVRASLRDTGLAVGDERTLSSGDIALRLTAT